MCALAFLYLQTGSSLVARPSGPKGDLSLLPPLHSPLLLDTCPAERKSSSALAAAAVWLMAKQPRNAPLAGSALCQQAHPI